MKRSLKTAAAVFILHTALPAHATPAEYMSRLFTEGLGRAPDEATWRANALFSSIPANCRSLDWYTITNNVYSSDEYNGLGYTNEEKVLSIYRGILSREPENAAAVKSWSDLLAAGHPISTLVSDFVTSSEFYGLRDNKICIAIPAGGNLFGADSLYRWGQQPAIPLTSASTAVTAASLQARLDAAGSQAAKSRSTVTVTLPQQTVVLVDRMLVVPPGVTLATAGLPSRNRYAKMARLVRVTNFSLGKNEKNAVISLKGAATSDLPGATLQSVWVSGQRDHVVNGVTINYMNEVATVLIDSGSNASVLNSRFDNPVGGATIGIEGAESTGVACNNVKVTGNLLTGYTNTHYGPAGVYRFSDGITIKCAGATVSDNTVMDASDVSIIQFYSGGIQPVQATKVSNNYLIATSVSAYAAMMYEPYYYTDTIPATLRDYTGSSFQDNKFWGAPGTRFEIGMVGGGRAWHVQQANPAKGGQFINNSNAGITTAMQVGIGVDGIKGTRVSGNALNYSAAVGKCSFNGVIVADTSSAEESTPSLISSNTNHGAAVSYTANDMNRCDF